MNEIVEIALFKIQEQRTQEEFLSYSQKFQEDFVKKQEGFKGRKLVKSKDGIWADIVTWRNMECAMNVEHQMMKNSAVIAYMLCIDENTVNINRMNIMKAY